MDGPFEQARWTRAQQMPVGAPGFFYCSDVQIFTVPFIVDSEPENTSVSNIWEHTWYVPFSIRPIGELSKFIPLRKASLTWPFVRDSGNVGGLLTAARAFASIYMPRTEWDDILADLGVDPEQYEDDF